MSGRTGEFRAKVMDDTEWQSLTRRGDKKSLDEARKERALVSQHWMERSWIGRTRHRIGWIGQIIQTSTLEAYLKISRSRAGT